MSEYFMLVSKSMWEHDPELVKDIFRANMSRHGLIPTGIEVSEETDWMTGSHTGIIALIATVEAPEEDEEVTKAWRPSNGTEGEVFAANRCERCVNDRWDHATATGHSCPIWMNALAGVDDFHLYWDADAGHGECDMFYPKSEERAAGLDAAREAVKNLRHSDDCYYAEGVLCHCEIKPALAAIDALREKQ